jgi:hypothetical protein
MTLRQRCPPRCSSSSLCHHGRRRRRPTGAVSPAESPGHGPVLLQNPFTAADLLRCARPDDRPASSERVLVRTIYLLATRIFAWLVYCADPPPPRTSRFWSFGTRSQRCAGKSTPRSRLGPTAPCSYPWPGRRRSCAATGSSPRAPCSPGTSTWSSRTGLSPDRQDDHRYPTSGAT